MKLTVMDLNKFDRNKPKIKLKNLKTTRTVNGKKLVHYKDNEIKK